MSRLATDIEVYKDYFYVGMKRLEDGLRVGMELSRRKNEIDPRRLKSILLQNTHIGFNFEGYDGPMLWYLLDLMERDLPAKVINAKMKAASDQIIQGGIRKWDVADHLNIRIPRNFDFIDLIEPQPNAIASLKTLNGRMFGKRMQDLPFEPDADLTDEEMDATNDYCLTSDLDATHNLFDALKEPLELRVALGKEYGMDFRSKSDSQIGEAIIKKRVEQITGQKVQRPKFGGEDVKTPLEVEWTNDDGSVLLKKERNIGPGSTFRYPIPDFMKFETPELQGILDRLRTTDFVVKSDGKVDLPKWLSDSKITLGGMAYQMGIGGLHSTEANRAVVSDHDFILVDADVASQYPSIIELLGLYPKALGPVFLQVYSGIKAERIKAKKRGKVVEAELKILRAKLKDAHEAEGGEILAQIAALETESKACKAKDKGLKIALNGVYGKLGSRYSILYAPHLLVSVTLTGQLTLLMLIERALKQGVGVVSGNTDGVLFRCPRDMYAGMVKDKDGKDTDALAPSPLLDICTQWEQDTSFALEFAEYKAIYNRSVNDYFALKASGGHKRKGVFGNWWSEHPDDNDPRMRLMKNPTATIVSDAVLNLLKDGTPLEQTIYNCTDIKQFVSIVKQSTGATWRGQYLGKTIRFYWSTDGEEIFKAKANDKTGNYAMAPRTDGSAPCMTLPDELPDDIDYARYISEAKQVLIDIGYSDKPLELVRLTKANTQPILMLWALAAC